MQLGQREKERQLLDKQIMTVNLDMSILNGISGKNVGTEATAAQKPPKLTLNQLAQVLKNKTDKSAYLQSQKHYVKEWLRDKGVNLKKINQQIKQNARVSAELGIFFQPKQPQTKSIGISVIRKKSIGMTPQNQPLVTFTQDFQIKFINKQKQVSLNREIIQSMKHSRQKNNFRGILINKIKESLPINEAKNKSLLKQQQQQLQNNTILSISRDQELMKEETRKNQYFDFVESLTKKGFNESIKKLKQVRPFWKIVLRHLQTIQHYAPILEKTKKSLPYSGSKDPVQLKLNSCMMYKSLKMIEHEFSKALPDTTHSYEKLDEIVKNMEKRNRKLKVWRNSNGEPSWARAYMLLRAGRRDEVKRVLEGVDREFLDDLLMHDQSLAKIPTPSYMRHQPSKYKDSFYTQLLYILQANQQFQPQLIVDDQPLTKTWILLRTLGVYRFDHNISATYQSIGKAIADVESKSKASLTSGTLENFLHLGLYRNLIYVLELILDQQIDKQFEGISYDDYFHLLMVVSIYPELWGDSSLKERVGLQTKFVQKLTKYMIKLRSDGFGKQTSKYLILSTVDNLPQITSQLITTRHHYQQFDWHSFKNLLRFRHPQRADTIYIDLTKAVLDSLELKTFKDFMYAAELYRSTFAAFDDAFYHEQKFYVKLLLKHLFFVEKKRYLVRKQQLAPEFTKEMFGFFEIGLEEQRDQGRLQRIDEEVNASVKECEMMIGKYVDYEAKNQDYKQNILQPYLFYQTVNELAKLLQNPMANFQQLKKFDNTLMYKNFKTPASRIEHNLNLLQYFRSEFNNQITSLYVFYLSMLVERKQILSSKQCDYSGVPAFVESVLGNLEAMDRACEARVERIDLKRISDEQERNQIVEANMNQLRLCPEYREFREEMYEYLRQYGGTYGMGLDGISNGKLVNKTTGVLV